MSVRENRNLKRLRRPRWAAAWRGSLARACYLVPVVAAMHIGGAAWAGTSSASPRSLDEKRVTCGSTLSSAQIEWELARDSSSAAMSDECTYTGPCYAPITVHVVQNDDGIGGISLTNIDTSLKHASALFIGQVRLDTSDWHLQYISSDEFSELKRYCYHFADEGIGGIHACNTSADCLPGIKGPSTCEFFYKCVGGTLDGAPCYLRDQCPGGECLAADDRLRLIENNPDTIDIYYVPDIKGACGDSSFPADDYHGVLVDNKCATDKSTTAHEIGHYFGLYDTHETAFGIACPDGSNASEAGDLIADTPADPNLARHVTSARDDPACQWDKLTCGSGQFIGFAVNRGAPCWLACSTPYRLGEDCAYTSDCEMPVTCQEGRCVGESCDGDFICAGGTCEDGTCVFCEGCLDDSDCDDVGCGPAPANCNELSGDDCHREDGSIVDTCSAGAFGPYGCPNLDARYGPDVNNVMSFSAASCRDDFTGMQEIKMAQVFEFDRDNLFRTTRYVIYGVESPNPAGTPLDPDGTLTAAIERASAGDHLFLASGLFPEAPMTISKPLMLHAWNPDSGAAVIGP